MRPSGWPRSSRLDAATLCSKRSKGKVEATEDEYVGSLHRFVVQERMVTGRKYPVETKLL